MYQTIQIFTQMVLLNPNANLRTLLNQLFKKIGPERTKEAEDYFLILYKTGEAIRQAPPEIQEAIRSDYGKRY